MSDRTKDAAPKIEQGEFSRRFEGMRDGGVARHEALAAEIVAEYARADVPASVIDFDGHALADFVEALGIDPASATFYCWRVVPSTRKNRKPGDTERITHAAGDVIGFDLDKIAELERRNRKGWNIALMLHNMSGEWHGPRRSRRKADILGWRVLSLDLDNGIPSSWPFGIAPTLTTETSPGHFQAHWVLDFPMAVEAGFALQRRMAEALGLLDHARKADGGANNPAQGWRPWGTVNTKDESAQFVARQHGVIGKRYWYLDLLAVFPEPPPPACRPTILTNVQPERHGEMLADLVRLSGLRPGDLTEWRALGGAFKAASNGADWGLALWRECSDSTHPDYNNDAVWQKLWRDIKPARTGPGFIWKLAKRAGVDLRTFGRQWASRSKREYRFSPDDHPDIRLDGFARVPNARYGTQKFVDLSHHARAVYYLLHVFHRGADNGQIRWSVRLLKDLGGPEFTAKTARAAIEELEAAGIISTTRNPGAEYHFAELCDVQTGWFEGEGYQNAPRLDWASCERAHAVKNGAGDDVEPMRRAGFTRVPNVMILSRKWRAYSLAERELIMLAHARCDAGGNGSIPMAENFITASAGISHGTELLDAICRKGALRYEVRGRRGDFSAHHLVEITAMGTGRYDHDSRSYATAPRMTWKDE